MSPRLEKILALAIFALAAALRLGRPEVTEFKRDEAGLYSLALDLAEFRAVPLRGIGSSVGLPNAPMSVYVFALPLLVWKSPLAATLFVGVLNTASVGLAYLMARRYWGARVALLAALLYAAAPWAIVYSRKIWAKNLLPLFVVGYVFTALLAFVEGRRRWLSAHLALLAVCVQLHLSGLSLIPLTGLWLVIFRRNVDWRMLGWGILAGAALFAPFAWYAIGAGWGGPASLLALLNRPAVFSTDALSLAALVAMGTDLHSLAGPQAFRDFLATIPDFTGLLYLGGALALAGAFSGVWRWLRPGAPGPTRRAGLLIALWLIAPIIVFIRHSTPVFPHYFIVLFPAPFILAGVFLDAVIGRLTLRLGPFIAIGVPVVIAAAQVWLTLAMLNFVATRATPGGFGMPLGTSLRVADLVRAAPDVIVASAGSDPNVDEVPAVLAALLRAAPHRFVDARTTAVLPANAEARVVLWPATSPLAAAQIYQAWGMTEHSISLRNDEGAVVILRSRTQPLTAPRLREASALLSNGAEVVGSGGTAREWQLWWRASESASDENFTVFAHGLNSNGDRVAQADVPTYPVRGWRAGDLVISLFSFEAQASVVRAGMYESQSLAPVAVLDVNGDPAAQWLEFAAP
jgi:4-amino-4-deoxy-L-arabinose transferase-like glycosyltransferase